MTGNRTTHLTFLLLIAIALLTTSVGCNRRTQYEVLSFFFTGVPTPEEQDQLASADPNSTSAVKTDKTTQASAHSYFIKRQCEQCHQMTRTLNFSAGSRSNMPLITFGAGLESSGGRLPLKKVCVGCHENRSADYASSNGLWLHAPATKDNCLVCHAPHRSSYPNLLKDESDNLCTMCHSEGQIKLTKSHKEPKSCRECHNPHLGRDRHLLVSGYKEVRLLPTPEVDENEKQTGQLE